MPLQFIRGATLVPIGPFSGTNFKYPPPKPPPPPDALAAAKKASRIIRACMDQMNSERVLKYVIVGGTIDQINEVFLPTKYKLSCLIGTMLDDICERKPRYPISEISVSRNKDPRKTIKEIYIRCFAIWEMPT